MNDQRPHGILKRKERESSSLPPAIRPPPPPPRSTVPAHKTTAATKPATGSKKTEKMTLSNNKLLAGCMAYEFLTKGTVLGHKYDTDRSEKPSMTEQTTAFNGDESYERITSLLMMETDGGDRVSGIVNPTQLRRWIEMK